MKASHKKLITKKLSVFALAFALIGAALAGCNTAPASDGGSTELSSVASESSQDTGGGTTTNEGGSGDAPSGGYGAGEFHKYDPPITVQFGKPLDLTGDGVIALEQAGEPYDDNRWVRYFRDEVGVESVYKLQANLTVDYDQQLLMAMAAGDLPDVFWVTNTQLSVLKQLAEAGAVADLSEVYQQHANPTLRSVIEGEGAEIFNPVTFDGKISAIPVKMPSTNGYNHLWVRQDWLDLLGLDRPTTMDEVMEVTKAFVEQDPHGTGDNIGMMLNNEYLAEMKGIFWAFGGKTAVRNFWATLDDGTVEFSEVQQEMKGGLGWLRDMHEQGLINREFATQNIDKAFEYVANNQCGIFYGPHWYGFRLYSAESSMDDTANWIPIGFPTGTGEPTKVYANNTFDAVTCVNANYENPEALIHLLNAYTEKLFGENNDFDNFFSCEQDDGVWSKSPVHTLDAMVDLTPHRQMKEAMANSTLDQLTGSGASYWNFITSGQTSYKYMFGPEDSCFNFVDDTYPDIVVWNGYFGAPTETWADRWSSMQELIDTTFLQIIQGTADLDSGFDNMVTEWYSIGGQAVTEEVNAIVATYN